MNTLEQLINARREELRQQKLDAEQEQQDAIMEQCRKEAVVARLFSEMIGDWLGLDMQTFPYSIEAGMVTESGQTFEICFKLNAPEQYPEVIYGYLLILSEDEAELEIIKDKDNSYPWDGWRNEEDWKSFSSVIDAIIYALGED